MESRHLKDDFLRFLKTLGLKEYYPNKLTLRSLLEINSASVSDEEVQTLQAIPWTFLHKLLTVNSNSRCLKCLPGESIEPDDLFEEQVCDATPNLLDLHTALFACADSFLQQEMALKMSMCQFAVPLVLPQGVHDKCTLMLWALRDILKEWRPHSMSDSKGFVEDSVVYAKIPLISFVRLSNCSLSKSQVLNQMLNNSQQHHDFFSHREMIGGSAPRIIANGMVEICWSLPCGNNSIDVFPEPVAIANLRGDVCTFETQFSFLTQVSTAVFVFLDSVDDNEQRLFASLQEIKSKIFLVINSQTNMSQNTKSLIKAAVESLQLERNHIIRKSQNMNVATFSATSISPSIKKVLSGNHISYEIEAMKGIAQELGLGIDESENRACASAEQTAEEIIKCIGVRQAVDFKKTRLPLQGENWKRLAQIEKEQCRLQNSAERNLEEYKAQLQKEKDEIRNKQAQYKMTKPMDILIKALWTLNDTERAFFLKWLGLKLDMRSRKQMSDLRNKYTWCEQQKDRDGIARIDQELLECSLGMEHFIREMGQIYEAASFHSYEMPNIYSLPTLVAKMLLAGFPLELLDGDASNIPEKWVSDVLMELHKMVGQKSRLLVLTVLGVQSTGKSTLLNTMFGVQFAVSSGRCTRGAFMIFLPVGNDLKEELLCDFVLLIDTEGLKSPALAQLEDSYEHDNELATFVIGLSDVTIINIAMENSTEMKDVLQIAVHAFLRMKEIGKKAVCHFVHQNVGGVSAYDKNMTDRKKLLEQLNEMTLIAAEMEKQPNVKKFTDVLDYDMEKNNWYIPGLWHGTPPMAPVNTGYSVAVLDFKKKLIERLKERMDEEPFQIPEFLKWMSSLWRAVKFENFIFSFRNTLVAHAYDNLCKEFSDWEWAFRRHILSLLQTAEVQISNAKTSSIHEVVEPFKEKSDKEIMLQTKAMNEKLKDYYKRKDRNVHLVEKYKGDFAKSIKSLESGIKDEVKKRLAEALEMRKNKEKVEEIHSKQTAMIERQVLQLLQSCKHLKELSDEDLKTEFEKMWRNEVANITGLKERDISADVLKQLRASLGNRQVIEDLQNVKDLPQCGQKDFKSKNKHVNMGKGFDMVKGFFKLNNAKHALDVIAANIITSCSMMIDQFTQSKSDYHETFTKDVLDKIDEHLKKEGSKYNTKFEFDLKVHICGIASRKFTDMHRKYLADQDPAKHLQKCKSQYLSDFTDLYREKDQCQRKARDFTQLCLKPAVTEYIDQSIGSDIVDAVLENKITEYNSRMLFQYTIQKDLLEKSTFNDYLEYILHYENYVKDWIYNHIIKCFPKDISLQKLKEKKMHSIITRLIKAVETSKLEANGSPLPNNAEGTTIFIRNLCKAMSDVLSISMNTVERVLFQNTSCCDPFTKSLYECITDLKQKIAKEISESTDITETLKNVSIKPQNELFKRVFGCGAQCPFCKTPCEAGGKEHQLHHASVHRPQGLSTYRDCETNVLFEEICTSSVHGNGTFENHETNFQPHPYKDYRKYYPYWHIAPDMSIESSDYWKYVLVTFNKQFAERYDAEPANYPGAWNRITKDMALISLKNTFNIT